MGSGSRDLRRRGLITPAETLSQREGRVRRQAAEFEGRDRSRSPGEGEGTSADFTAFEEERLEEQAECLLALWESEGWSGDIEDWVSSTGA